MDLPGRDSVCIFCGSFHHSAGGIGLKSDLTSRCSLRGREGKARTVGPWKQREQADYLEKHTANTPHVHLVVVVTVREQTLRGTIPVHQHNTVGYESHFKHCLQCNIHADTLVSCKVMLMASCRQHFEAKVTNEPIGHLGELTNGWRCIPCRAA